MAGAWILIPFELRGNFLFGLTTKSVCNRKVGRRESREGKKWKRKKKKREEFPVPWFVRNNTRTSTRRVKHVSWIFHWNGRNRPKEYFILELSKIRKKKKGTKKKKKKKRMYERCKWNRFFYAGGHPTNELSMPRYPLNVATKFIECREGTARSPATNQYDVLNVSLCMFSFPFCSQNATGQAA